MLLYLNIMERRKCAACDRILNETDPSYFNSYIGLLCKFCYSKNLVGYRKNLRPRR
jgi:hypothetical protein